MYWGKGNINPNVLLKSLPKIFPYSLLTPFGCLNKVSEGLERSIKDMWAFGGLSLPWYETLELVRVSF